VHNTVTGEQFKVSYTTGGDTIVQHVGSNSLQPSVTGNLAETAYRGETTRYEIANGKVVTTLSQTHMEITVYKLGDTYYASRSNEFGYVNYEILPKAPLFLDPLPKSKATGS
jgi:hypothetical protein